MNLPHETHPAQELQAVVCDVDLPPCDAVASRGRIVVMVVVPTVAQPDDADEPMIPTVIGRWEAAVAADHVTDGLDEVSRVPDHHGAETQPPDDARPTEPEVHRKGIYDDRDLVVIIKPDQLRKLYEVTDPG